MRYLFLALLVIAACAPSPADELAAQLESFPSGKVEYDAASVYEGETVTYTMHEYLLDGLWRRDSFSEGAPEQRAIAKGGAYYRCTNRDGWNCTETVGENLFLVTDRVLAMVRSAPGNFTVAHGEPRTIAERSATCYDLDGEGVTAAYCFSPDGYVLSASVIGDFWGNPFEQRLDATAINPSVTPEDFALPKPLKADSDSQGE